MTDLKKRRLAFLEETARFYNLNNRAVADDGSCRYWLCDKPGCAIGRHIEDKELCKTLDAMRNNAENTGVSNPDVFVRLPDKLRELGQDFLTSVQNLHDCEGNWSETGLSPVGEVAVLDLKASFNLFQDDPAPAVLVP